MPKKAKKPEDYQQIANRILDAVVPDAEKPRKKKAIRSPKPTTKQSGF